MKLWKKNNKKISITNYVLLVMIFVVTVFGVLVLRNLYLTRQENNLNIPVLRNTLTHEIHSNELDSYINENQDAIIYIGVSQDDACRKFEKSIQKYIAQNGLSDEIIYLNISDTNTKKFFQELNQTYDYQEDITSYPALISFKNGKIEKAITGNLKKDDFINFVSKGNE